MSEELGLSVTRKDDFSKWYLEVVRKGGFKDQRTPTKGMDVIMPWGYALWEKIQELLDIEMKARGVRNACFPLLIPESFIEKEKEHFEGFEAEAVMATHVGKTKFEEPYIIRPTSETIMYYMYSLWIRSHKDLPLKINQWCNVVRWDTKETKPFVRDREFLWMELHTAHANREDALKEIDEEQNFAKKLYEALAMAALVLKRPKHDTFPGAEFSVAYDTLVQDGRVMQGPGTHFLGQNFAKAFEIMFEDRNNKKQHVWQTCLGISTRQLGAIIMHHGDDKGAMLPPLISPIQVVIVPIMFKNRENDVLNKANEIKHNLEKLNARVHVDDRADYSAGFKFNEWELKGVPLRIEIGPKDIDAHKFVCVRRLDGKKIDVSEDDAKQVIYLLNETQEGMYERSKQLLRENVHDIRTMTELKALMQKGGIARANWCGSSECANWIKDKTNGGEVRGTKYGESERVFGECIYCGKHAEHVVYIAKAY
ncbi:MAG: proline--tRNA ligase [Candidatus Aenigmatarchaeota archaeon]